MISTLRSTKFQCKICKKEIEKYNFKVHIENVHKGFLKNTNVMSVAKITQLHILQLFMKQKDSIVITNCDQCGKIFTRG